MTASTASGFPAHPLVSRSDLDEANRDAEEAIKQYADALLPESRHTAKTVALSAEDTLEIVRAVVGAQSPVPASGVAEEKATSGQRGFLYKLAMAAWPYQAFWCFPVLALAESLVPPEHRAALLAIAPATAWLLFALLGIARVPVVFHLRLAAVWQVWTAWPHAVAVWTAFGATDPKDAAQRLQDAATAAGPAGAASIAMATCIVLSMVLWESLRD